MKKYKQLDRALYWQNLTDDELLDTELRIDDPERLENLVYEIPPGNEETYVEFKYDFSGSGREELTCVHGHHKHLKGFVMRKGNARILVGWMCAKSIYGEVFDEYEADFNQAENRKKILYRSRETRNLISQLMLWIERALASETFDIYEGAQRQLKEKMPWIWENARRAAHVEANQRGLKIPSAFFDLNKDPRDSLIKIATSVSALAATTIAKTEIEEPQIRYVQRVLETTINQIEDHLSELRGLEELFQPAILELICKYANKHDNPQKRNYAAGLLLIECFRSGKGKSIIELPKNYKVHDKSELEKIKESLRTL